MEEIVERKTGDDPGTILDIIPERRGASGRILRLTVKGTKRNILLTTELEIRRALSETHLPSSNFYPVMEKHGGIPDLITLRGAGWGHGVGMCQLGAIHRAQVGESHKDILSFYFPGTDIRKIY